MEGPRCIECDLCIHSEPGCLIGSGNDRANIMIINSCAGDNDEALQRAVMPVHLINRLKDLGFDNPEGDFYYTNAIKCRTPKGTKIKVSEIKKCKKWLDEEIKLVKPKYVLLIGAQAIKATIEGSITALNGVLVERKGIKYMPAYSPGIVFMNPGKAKFVEQAFSNFKAMVEGQDLSLPELNIKMVKTPSEVTMAFRELKRSKAKVLSYDIETTGLDRFEEVITLFGFGNDKTQYILPLEVKFSPLKGKYLVQTKLVRQVVKGLEDFKLVAGNGKFDNLFLEHNYYVKPTLDFDLVLASHCLDENTPNGVKENAIIECNASNWDINKNLKTGNVKTMQDYDDYVSYLGYDILYEYKLYKAFNKKLKQDNALRKLFNHLYMPVIRAYEEVEKHGVYIYQRQFKEARKFLEGKLKRIEEKLSEHKEGVNWASPDQVADFLYRDLKLPVIETTDSGKPSTGEGTLLKLKDKHEAVALILEHRGVKIQISHFIDGWINRMVKGRLHPSFKLLTVTGRTSCKDPNLQQVPRDPQIRNLIGAPPGRSFIEADFSQAELRIATILSGDPEMKRIYQTGGDIHTNTYEIVSGERLSGDKYEVKEKRKKAKAINFGFLYGMGWRKFKEYAEEKYGLKLTEKQAQEYRKRFFDVYKGLPAWHTKQRKIVKSLGQVRNPIGRIRRLPDINSSEQGKRAEAERQAINSPVQGFGSDITLLGMAEVMQQSYLYHEDLRLDRSRFDAVGTVHDSTLFEVDDDYLLEFIPKVKRIMQSPKALEDIFKFESPVPIVVDIAVGKSWGAGVELDFSKDWQSTVKEMIRDGKVQSK